MTEGYDTDDVQVQGKVWGWTLLPNEFGWIRENEMINKNLKLFDKNYFATGQSKSHKKLAEPKAFHNKINAWIFLYNIVFLVLPNRMVDVEKRTDTVFQNEIWKYSAGKFNHTTGLSS